MLKSARFWVLVFISMIALAALLIYGFDWDKRSLLGFPLWLIVFFFYMLGFSLVLWVFCQTYWLNNDDE